MILIIPTIRPQSLDSFNVLDKFSFGSDTRKKGYHFLHLGNKWVEIIK